MPLLAYTFLTLGSQEQADLVLASAAGLGPPGRLWLQKPRALNPSSQMPWRRQPKRREEQTRRRTAHLRRRIQIRGDERRGKHTRQILDLLRAKREKLLRSRQVAGLINQLWSLGDELRGGWNVSDLLSGHGSPITSLPIIGSTRLVSDHEKCATWKLSGFTVPGPILARYTAYLDTS